jgi:hypothetical protein
MLIVLKCVRVLSGFGSRQLVTCAFCTEALYSGRDVEMSSHLDENKLPKGGSGARIRELHCTV